MGFIVRARILRALVALPLATVGFSATANASPIVKIGVVSWIGYGPLYVAEKLDLFDKYGVKVKLVNFSDGALLAGATASNAVNASTLTYDQVIPAVATGLPIKVVMPIDYSDGADAIVATDSIKNVSDFKGNKVAYNFGTPSEFLLAYALKQSHLGFHDISKVNIPAGEVPSVLASGAIPIGVTWQPHVSQILSLDGGKKFHVVYSSKDAPGLISDTLAFNTNFIQSNPQQVRGVIEGYIAGMRYMQDHHNKAMAIIAKAIHVSPASAAAQYAGVKNIPLRNMEAVFTKSKSTLSYYTSGDIISKIQLKDKDISHIPATPLTFDDGFVKGLAKY
ncbi:MAG: ABC transporter substrate-binding protein [Acidithiobacillus sp.]